MMKLTNNIFNFIKRRHVLYILAGFGLSLAVASCADDVTFGTEPDPSIPKLNIDYENSLMVPLSINLGSVSVSTRETDTQSDDDSDFQNGSSAEHIIDFNTDNECYAIFFDDDGNFMYLKPLVTAPSLGSGGTPTDGIGEYEVYALSYIDKPKFRDQEEGEKDEDYAARRAAWEVAADGRLAELPAKILVVLNGGRIYKELLDGFDINPETGKQKPESTKLVNTDSFLNFEWTYTMGNNFDLNGSETPEEIEAKRLQVIGINTDGHYTMTNSAYYGQDYVINEEGVEVPVEGSTVKLQTVRPVTKTNIVDAVASNIVRKNCAAKIYVERMVAKFSAPKFPTEKIGGEPRVFEPSTSAQAVSVYTWNDRNRVWNSEDVKWRVHVLGWTINGREKSNFLYKHIGSDTEPISLNSWTQGQWNDPAHKRSYWSVDPHYVLSDNNESDGNEDDFYPWQFRGAHNKHHISWMHQNDPNAENNKIALRYLKFKEVNYWDDNAITISENTFDPYKNSQFILNKEEYLDSRASLLMGPHLLVTAEIFLESNVSSGNEYVSNYSRVDDLYGDRYFRYYRTEKDMFRMFVQDINDALRTQSLMSFNYYSWLSNDEGVDNPDIYQAKPTGHCQLMFDCELGVDYENSLNTEEHATYLLLKQNKDLFHGKKVADVIDLLVAKNIPLTIKADVKDGDARVLPWIPGMVFRNIEEGKFNDILPVANTTPGKEQDFTAWTDSMRKSLIFEWFGTIDHYYRGYMYYAADIPHHITKTDDKGNKEGYYGAVRNHWYTFTVTAINSLGTPVDDVEQRIIPGRYKYRDQMSVYVDLLGWHFMGDTQIGFQY